MAPAPGDASTGLESKAEYQPTLGDYGRVTTGLVAFGCLLYWLTQRYDGVAAKHSELLGPLFAMTLLVS